MSFAIPVLNLKNIAVFWFRRDLRLKDNAGLFYALKENVAVLPLFIYDTDILDQLESKSDRRVDFISQALRKMNDDLKGHNSALIVLHGQPEKLFEKLLKNNKITAVYTNHDYEPYARERDKKVQVLLEKNGVKFQTYKDQTIFEKNEILKTDGTPYTVFTPYSRQWKNKLTTANLEIYTLTGITKHFVRLEKQSLPALKDIGFEKTDIVLNLPEVDEVLLQNYKRDRDTPSLQGTSRLSIYLRFGVLSIRQLVKLALKNSETWLNELIWREFYMMILWHFPHVEAAAFKKKFNRIKWRNNEKEFTLWCEGKTGFPIVDAGMRELLATGFMHNRVRMIVSSFLVKDLLIDWRWGEAWFAKNLNDYDLSANNGGWQWAAGTGCDAAPYFRIFNPAEQQKKFDPEFKYIRKWVKEFGTPLYPSPIVDHAAARLRALDRYKKDLLEES